MIARTNKVHSRGLDRRFRGWRLDDESKRGDRLVQGDLGEHDEKLIERQIAEGRFASASDVLRAALSLLERQNADDEARFARAISESLNDPRPSIPADDVFERLERRFAADMAARRDGA